MVDSFVIHVVCIVPHKVVSPTIFFKQANTHKHTRCSVLLARISVAVEMVDTVCVVVMMDGGVVAMN